MILSPSQARSYASNAGFKGNSLNIIVAIAQAESSLSTTAQYTNNDGSLDRGIMQINNRWHPEVSDSCAYNAACAFQQAYRISSMGSDFTPWATYNAGKYLRFLSSGETSTTPTQQGHTNGVPWYDFPINTINDYVSFNKGPGTDTPHYAVDIEAPQGTPFFFLQPGTIKQADFQAWGGQIFEQPDAGGPEEYVYHLDTISAKVGQHVTAGQVVGTSGGQTSGGTHPTSAQFSTGPHIHFGEFTSWAQGPSGTIPYGPDPNPLIHMAQIDGLGDSGGTGTPTGSSGDGSTGVSTNAPVPISDQVNTLLGEFPGFTGIAIVLDEIEHFPGIIWYNVNSSVNLVPGGSVGDIINGAASAVFDPADYIGAGLRSLLDTIVSNTTPLLVRGMVTGLGLLLIVALVWKAVGSSNVGSAIEGVAMVA